IGAACPCQLQKAVDKEGHCATLSVVRLRRSLQSPLRRDHSPLQVLRDDAGVPRYSGHLTEDVERLNKLNGIRKRVREKSLNLLQRERDRRACDEAKWQRQRSQRRPS